LEGKAALIHPDACTYDAVCEAICPTGAIELPYLICTPAMARTLSLSTGVIMNPYAYIASVYESMPEIPQDSILSRTLHADDDVKVVLFGFATGQELSEHTASMPATIIILRGEADLTLGGDKVSGVAGTVAHMAANLPHSVYAKTPVVMLLLMIRSGKEGKSA
jgi:quercetin dioxygenase-like cupin family protein